MCNVLVIDDEQMILSLLAQVLRGIDFSVETAENGSMGIRKFDAGAYDLVITDICMPDPDGTRVVDHIRASKRSRTPVIGMSGTPWKLANPVFDRVLQKPFLIGKLVETARSLAMSAS